MRLIGFLKQNRKISRWGYVIGGHLGFLMKKVPISISFFFFVFQPFISKFCRNVLWELSLKPFFLVFHFLKFSFFPKFLKIEEKKSLKNQFFGHLFNYFSKSEHLMKILKRTFLTGTYRLALCQIWSLYYENCLRSSKSYCWKYGFVINAFKDFFTLKTAKMTLLTFIFWKSTT